MRKGAALISSTTLRRIRLENLMESTMYKKFTIVCGAPGTGKTTCVENFLQLIKRPYLYYSLKDDGDCITSFLNSLSTFVKSLSPNLLIDLPKGTSIETYTKALETIFPTSEKEKEIYIVLDDYYNNTKENDFHDYVQLFINDSPSNIHYILITNEDLTWYKLHSQIYRSLYKINNWQLMLTKEEIYEYFNGNGCLKVDDNIINNIYMLTEGWVVALVSIKKKMEEQPECNKIINEEPEKIVRRLPELIEYIEYIFLRGLTEEQKNVLFATSIVKELNEILAVRLSGENTIDILDVLCNKNKLIRSTTINPKTYTYNNIWRLLLYNKALSAWGTERLNELNKIAGSYYLEQEQWRDAIIHFIEAGDLHHTSIAMEKCIPEVLDKSLFDKLSSLIKKTPVEVINNNPWLQYGYACILRFKEPQLCFYFISHALENFRAKNDTRGIIRTLFLKSETLMFYTDNGLHKMADLLNDPDLYSKNNKGFDSRIIAYKQIYASWTHNYLTGNLRKAIDFADQARRTSLIIGDINLNIWACYNLGIAFSFQGDFEIAKGYITEAIEKTTETDVDSVLLVLIPYLAGFNADLAGDFESAKKWLNLSLCRVKELKYSAWNFYIRGFLAYALDYLGDFKSSEYMIDEMKAGVITYLNENNNHLRSYYLAALAHHCSIIGKPNEALTYAQKSLKLRQIAGGEVYFIRCHIILGAIYRQLGNYIDAEIQLLEALQKSKNSFSLFFEASCYIQLSLLYNETGNKERFNYFINNALYIAEEKSLYHFFMWKDEDIVTLIKVIEQTESNKNYLNWLIEKRKLSINNNINPVLPNTLNSMDGTMDSHKSIKLYLMGPFSIEINGHKSTGGGSRKALYLLKMLSVKNDVISVQKIITEMWPEWDTKLAMNNFYFTLHKLRKIINNNDLVIFEDNLCKLTPDFYWSDVLCFDMLLTEAKGLIKAKREKEALEILRKAANLYRGEFLEGEDLGEILTLERESIERKYYGVIIEKTSLLIKLGEHNRAIEVLEKVRANSYFDESAYRLLMIAYYSQGNPMQSFEVYKKLKEFLYQEMRALPHKITNKLYENISKGVDVSDIIQWLFKVSPNE